METATILFIIIFLVLALVFIFLPYILPYPYTLYARSGIGLSLLVYIIYYAVASNESTKNLVVKSEKRLVEAEEKLDIAAKKAGLDSELIKEGIKSTCAYGIPPCRPEFIEDDKGCCIVDPASTLSKSQRNFLIAGPIIKTIAITYIAEELVEQAAAYLGKKLAGKAAAKLTETAVVKASTMLVSNLAGKMGALLIGFAKLLSNPFLMLAQLGTAILDIFDVGGYTAYQSNEAQQKIKNLISVAMEKMLLDNGSSYPMLMPVSYIFPESMRDILDVLSGDFIGDAMTALSKDPAGLDIITKILMNSLDPTAPGLTDEDGAVFSSAVSAAMNAQPKKRDSLIYLKLMDILPDDRKDFIKVYPEYSTAKSQGISLTEKGVAYWNNLNREKWLSDDDNAPFVALWTNSYEKLNVDDPKDKKGSPNVITVKLTEYLPLVFPFKTIFQNCEGSLVGGMIPGAKTTVLPYQFGVRFNYKTGLCTLTRNWCTRMGRNYDSSGTTNCPRRPGDVASENILGATLTAFNTQLHNTLKDSYQVPVGKLPTTCKETEEADNGLCYPKCQTGYKGVGPVCWQDCPSGYRDDGGFCAKPGSYGRGGGYAIWDKSKCEKSSQAKVSGGCEKNGALYYPKCKAGFHNVGCCVCSPNCINGMKDIGVSCTKKTIPRGAGTSKKCPTTMSEGAGLCYEKCKSGFYGLGSTCYPCTGLEVTDGQKEQCRQAAPTVSSQNAYSQQLLVNLEPKTLPLKNFDLMVGKSPLNISSLDSDNFISVDEIEGYDTQNDIRIFRQGPKNVKRILSKNETNITKFCKSKCSDDSLCKAIFISGSSEFKRPCNSFAGFTEVGCDAATKTKTESGEYSCYILKSARPEFFEDHGIEINGLNGVRTFGDPPRTQTIAAFSKR